MKYIAILLMLISASTQAITTTCKIDGMFMYTIIGWDSESGKAKLSDIAGNTIEGNLIHSRKHNDGYAYNISFKTKLRRSGERINEFVISNRELRKP